MAEFFENDTPRQMLEKASREFQRLVEDVTSDNVFNFFVTAYHIVDRVTGLGTVPPKDTEELYSNPDFRMCRYICLKSKHLKLDTGDAEFVTHRRPAAIFGEAVFGESVYNMGRAYFITDKKEKVDVLELGERVLKLWEDFLARYDM